MPEQSMIIILCLWGVFMFITLSIIVKGCRTIYKKCKKPKPEKDYANVIFPEDFNPSKRQ